MMNFRVPLSPSEIGRNEVTTFPLSLGRSNQASDRGTRHRDPAINTMTPSAFSAGRDIDRAVFLHLTQCDPFIEQGGFFETQPECPGDFHHRRDPLVPVLAQLVSTLVHDLSIEACGRVCSCS